ncbi:hypothetical protein [Litoribacter populi]|uniref:hypothetical protein n=1 Tax=Litoribacter populi TaxID=2598460 RepID=UPI0011811D47|nr:hypothetical protein [Litoribacter populi]
MAQNTRVDVEPSGIVIPISIEIDPMEKLLLDNFEKDPDTMYVGFEPQVFNDTINGTGHLIIGWRTDKKIDVYHQKSLTLDSLKYSIAGAGLNKMIAVDMDKASYEVNDVGVQAHYKFRDMLDAATHPTSLPMVLLHDF